MGLAQPGFGILADRYGDRRALWLGFVCYLAGMLICVFASSAWAQHLGAGVLVGMGISGTAFGLVLAVVGRAAPEHKRAHYLGITSAMGSAGQVVLPLLTAWLIEWLDWRMTLLVITATLVPMALCIPRLRVAAPAHDTAGAAPPPLPALVRGAFGYRDYLLLNAGFFVCGFHLAFITAHLPTYVQNFCVSAASPAELRALGLQALALAGLANIFGTLFASRLGMRFPKPYVLAGIYAARPGDPDLHHAAADAGLGDDLRPGDGRAVAVHGAADQRPGAHPVRAACHGHPVRLRVSQPPTGQFRRRLAGRRILRSLRQL
ncbi:MFS transporter [Alcanivorax sp. IO_7]|nr:MFS transporter [Alcanivorax sp. IO_7]